MGCLFPPKKDPEVHVKDNETTDTNEVVEPTESGMYNWMKGCLFPEKVHRGNPIATITKKPPRKVLGPLADLYADIDEYVIVFDEV